MKIGIFGGSFNPPHNMHKNITLRLIENGYLDKVIYVPTGDNYNKKDLINFKDRYNMVELMINNNDNLLISNIGNNEHYQYTYQTLDYFDNIYINNDIYFICGTDNLDNFYTWKNYEYILENYKILVIIRNNDDINNIVSNYSKYRDKIIIVDIEFNNLSSTYIRNNINNDKIREYLDEKVYNYIKRKKLYYKMDRTYQLKQYKNKVIIR